MTCILYIVSIYIYMHLHKILILQIITLSILVLVFIITLYKLYIKMSWILMFYSLKNRRESFVRCFSNFIEVFFISASHT